MLYEDLIQTIELLIELKKTRAVWVSYIGNERKANKAFVVYQEAKENLIAHIKNNL